MERRSFLRTAGLGAAGVAAAPFVNTASAQETITWNMVTSWPKNFPALGTGANDLAARIERMSGGRMKVRVHGAGEMVPPMEVFDAVSQGTAEMGHSASYYWKGKHPATPFFTAVPFGLTAQELNSWVNFGGGQELWDELYGEFGLKPLPCGNSGTQMAGWFRKEINSLEDIKGLKIRAPGLADAGAQVIERGLLCDDRPAVHDVVGAQLGGGADVDAREVAEGLVEVGVALRDHDDMWIDQMIRHRGWYRWQTEIRKVLLRSATRLCKQCKAHDHFSRYAWVLWGVPGE